MAVIGVKSITGITSITNAAGGADVLTFHSNNTTERLRIKADGNIEVATTTTTSPAYLKFNSNRSNADDALGGVHGVWNGNSVAGINFKTGADTGNKDDGRIQFVTYTGGSANTRMVIREDGRVLVGDGGAITPVKQFDVRGTGYQGILVGSTNNQGAQLIIDGIGGGDASGGNYSGFDVGTDGHLKIKNYDADKDIILGTGSQSGANDTVVITDTQRVGINDTTPSVTLETVGHNQVTFGSMPETIITYGTTSAYNSGSSGSGIQFGGNYNTTPEHTIFAGVHGVKENTTNAHYAGALVFSTRANGGNSAERVRINSGGRVGIKNNLSNTFWGNANTLCIGDGGGAVGLTFFTAGAADGSHISFQESTGSSPEGLISYYQGGYSTTADRDNMIFKTNTSERLRITNVGNIGVNCDSPTNISNSRGITIKGAGGAEAGFINFMDSADNSDGRILASDGELNIHADPSDNTGSSEIVFHVDGGRRGCINAAGQFLMGRTTPITIASDPGDACFEQLSDNGMALTLHCNKTNKRGLGIYYPSSSGATDAIRFQIGNAAKFLVISNGNCQNANNTYTNISDSRLKENIVDANSQWNDIKNIKIRNYNFKASTGHETHTQIGVIAQEIETICPKLVDSSGKGGIKAVASSVLYMKAVKALQEAMARIETLEAEVAALKSS